MDSRKWKIFLVHKILNQQLIKIEKRLQKENKMVEENGEKENENKTFEATTRNKRFIKIQNQEKISKL